jgi:hypothetical protein
VKIANGSPLGRAWRVNRNTILPPGRNVTERDTFGGLKNSRFKQSHGVARPIYGPSTTRHRSEKPRRDSWRASCWQLHLRWRVLGCVDRVARRLPSCAVLLCFQRVPPVPWPYSGCTAWAILLAGAIPSCCPAARRRAKPATFRQNRGGSLGSPPDAGETATIP